MTLTDLFCSSQVVLPQSGSVFIAGGSIYTEAGHSNSPNNRSNIYANETLTPGNTLKRQRYYSSATVLPNGEVYIQGGLGGEDLPELRDLGGNFRLLTGVATGPLHYWYPRNYVAPDGRVFGYDANGVMYYVSTSGNGNITTAGQLSSNNAGVTASAAMFRPGKILQIGGNSNGAIVIDIN